MKKLVRGLFGYEVQETKPGVKKVVLNLIKVKCNCGRVVQLTSQIKHTSTGATLIRVYPKHTLPTKYRMTGNGGTEPIRIKCNFSNQPYYEKN